MPAFIFITESDPEFERKSDKDRKALSKTTCDIHIKDGEPSLRLPSCSHSSGSSSTFHETNKNVKVFFFCQMILIQSTVHISLVISLSHLKGLQSEHVHNPALVGVAQRGLVTSFGVHVAEEALGFEKAKGVSQPCIGLPTMQRKALAVSGVLSGCPHTQPGCTSWPAV